MKFNFVANTKVDISRWNKCTNKLEQDLKALASSHIPEDVVTKYLEDMSQALSRVDNEQCEGMLFLMYAPPSSMPADARVDFVYKPTYIAATIFMTAINRYKNIAANEAIRKTAGEVLEASLGRNFLGAGYNEIDGLLDTLKIFAMGDTAEFVKNHTEINNFFAIRFEETIAFLETEICSGKIKDVWSGEDYSAQGRHVLTMLEKRN